MQYSHFQSEHNTHPIIGSCWNHAPERLTLSEARKREAGKELWERVTRYFTALKTLGGSNG